MEENTIESSNRKCYRILLAEDCEVNQKLVRLILHRAGYQVDVAANGQQALEAYKQNHYDLILMDIQMPEEPGGEVSATAGIEATRELKSFEATKHIPIVATSAHDLPEQRNRFREAGCDDIQSKPYTDFNELISTIERNLQGPSAS